MADHEVFNIEAEINSFANYQSKLALENPDLSPEAVQKQALIDFNTVMFPRQLITFFSEKNGEEITSAPQVYEVINGRLVDQFYGPFQKMIDFATSEEERQTLTAFETQAVAARSGEIIKVLDTSAIGKGGGIKYLDEFEKDIDGSVKHKARIDLTGDGPDLSFDEAKLFLAVVEKPVEAFLPIIQQPINAVELKRVNIEAFETVKTEKPTRTDLEGPSVVFRTPEPPVKAPKILESKLEAKRPDKQPLKRVETSGLEPEVVEVVRAIETVKTEKPTRRLLVGVEDKIKPAGPVLEVSEVVKPIVISEFTKKVIVVNKSKAPSIIKPKLSRQSRQPTKTVFVGFAGSRAEVVKPCFQNESKEEEKLQTPKQEEFKEITKSEKTTRRLLVGGKKTTVVFRTPQKNLRVMTGPVKRETPIIQLPVLKLLPLKNIPEWIWQGTAAGSDEIIDWQWLSAMIFYALLNTKVGQSEKISLKIIRN